MLLRPFDAADASVGLGHDSESMTLEQLTRGGSSAQPKQVFQMVAEEGGRLLAARTAATVRFDQDSAVIVGSRSDGEGAGIEVGTLGPYSDPGSPVYRATHEGGRVDDYAE